MYFLSPDSEIMTRWARAKNVQKHKTVDAASWSQLRAGVVSSRNFSDSLTLQRANKNKQVFVKGFKDSMKHKRQPIPKGQQGEATEEQDIREAVAIALKRNGRRENRRIKRQHATKSNMVCNLMTFLKYCDLC